MAYSYVENKGGLRKLRNKKNQKKTSIRVLCIANMKNLWSFTTDRS